MKQILIPVFTWVAAFAVADEQQPEGTFVDPTKAGPDYAVQGEYSGTLKVDEESADFGVQVIAMGNHEFEEIGRAHI